MQPAGIEREFPETGGTGSSPSHLPLYSGAATKYLDTDHSRYLPSRAFPYQQGNKHKAAHVPSLSRSLSLQQQS